MKLPGSARASSSRTVDSGLSETEERHVKWFVRALQEPLLHFLVLAAGLFALSYVFSRSPTAQQPDTILVSQQRLKNLILIFQRTWQRPPTQQELDGIVNEYVKEEVFYREALAMGLDRDDTLVRRRLRQKLEFVAEDIADAVEPTDQELQQYLDEHPEAFRVQRRTTFSQVYLSRQRRGDSLAADSKALLSELRSGSAEASEAGDPSLLPRFHESLTESQVSSFFGPEFSAQLFATQAGGWSGPLESAYGAHLVLLQEKTDGRVPELDEVRQAVRREWIAQRRAASKEEFFQTLLRKCNVVVEELDFVGDDPLSEAGP
jgi:hypothetical protein